METRPLAACGGGIQEVKAYRSISELGGFALIYLHFSHTVSHNKGSSENGVYHWNDNISQMLREEIKRIDNALQ